MSILQYILVKLLLKLYQKCTPLQKFSLKLFEIGSCKTSNNRLRHRCFQGKLTGLMALGKTNDLPDIFPQYQLLPKSRCWGLLTILLVIFKKIFNKALILLLRKKVLLLLKNADFLEKLLTLATFRGFWHIVNFLKIHVKLLLA